MGQGKVYAPRPGTALLPAFCAHFLAQHPLPLARADATVWVPSRRIGDTFKDALTQAAGGATTLPRVLTISYDRDLDAALQFNDPAGDDLPPAGVITALERTLFLAQRIRILFKGWSLEQATAAADSLGQLFDTFFDNNLTLADLQAQLPDAHAAHWQKNLLFLQLVFEEYPQWLASQGKLDARQHLHRLLQQQIESYQKGEANPVYALGFADTTALGLVLLRSILQLPKGELWLPPTPLEALADPLPATHPFATTRQLLHDLGVQPADVHPLGDAALHHNGWDRVFTPAPHTHTWQETPPEGSLAHLSLIEAQTPAAEADAIALRIRSYIEEDKHKTIALVTPNRSLATQVAASLTQWDIRANDSAGSPFITTDLGRALGLLLTLRQDGLHPQTLAALLAHPLIDCAPATAQTLDRDLLRGLWGGQGWQGYHQKLAGLYRNTSTPPHLQDTLTRLEDAMRPLLTLHRATLAGWLQAAIQSLCALMPATQPLEGEEADQLAQCRDSLLLASDSLGEVDAFEGVDYLIALLRQYPARLSQYQHPRVFIWGTQEARLQAVDHVILASLNSNHWPRGLGSTPWLNPQMMASLGLPAPEIRLGLNAHDFYSLLQTPQVTLTRSLREADGTETTPSPYLLRLMLAFGPGHPEATRMKTRGQYWLNLAHSVNLSLPDQAVQATPPAAPVPDHNRASTGAVPSWSMSHIRNLLQCPYKAYASRILGLKELDPYDADPDAADMGTLLHRTLEAFFAPVEGWPAPFTSPLTAETLPAALAHWETISQQTLAEMRLASLQALWAPRLKKIGRAILSQIAEDSPNRRVDAVEKQYKLPGSPQVTARLDRLDTTPQGAVVVDYKTGSVPAWPKVHEGWEPQLLLEGALLEAAGTPVTDLEFWQLNVKAGGLERTCYTGRYDDLAAQITLAQQQLEALKAHFTAEGTPYPATPAGASTLKLDAPCKNCPYQGVCRLHEWYESEARP